MKRSNLAVLLFCAGIAVGYIDLTNGEAEKVAESKGCQLCYYNRTSYSHGSVVSQFENGPVASYLLWANPAVDLRWRTHERALNV